MSYLVVMKAKMPLLVASVTEENNIIFMRELIFKATFALV